MEANFWDLPWYCLQSCWYSVRLSWPRSLAMIIAPNTNIIMAAQLGLARQSIEYTTYSAARAAVICESQSQAQQAAELLVEDMAQDIPGVEPGSVSVNIRNYMGSIWQKGGLIKCTVEAKVNTISPWSNSTVAADITMMIERPAVPSTKEEGGQ